MGIGTDHDDKEVEVRRVPPVLSQEESKNWQASQPGDLHISGEGQGPRTRRAVLQATLATNPFLRFSLLSKASRVVESRDFKRLPPMPADLRRSMSLAHATSMVIGIILGASVFIQPSEITRLVPNTRGLMLVWLAAGALTLCGALVCAELSSVFPDTGGVYVFLKRIFSPALGFLWGWGMFWSVHSGIIAAIAVILARYVAYFVPLGENAIRAVAITAILGL